MRKPADPNDRAFLNGCFAALGVGLACLALGPDVGLTLRDSALAALVAMWVVGWGVAWATLEFYVAFRGYAWSYP